jgi:hypothetical protein
VGLWKAQKVFRMVIIGIGPRLVKKPGKATWDCDKIKSYANIFNSARALPNFWEANDDSLYVLQM